MKILGAFEYFQPSSRYISKIRPLTELEARNFKLYEDLVMMYPETENDFCNFTGYEVRRSVQIKAGKILNQKIITLSGDEAPKTEILVRSNEIESLVTQITETEFCKLSPHISREINRVRQTYNCGEKIVDEEFLMEVIPDTSVHKLIYRAHLLISGKKQPTKAVVEIELHLDANFSDQILYENGSYYRVEKVAYETLPDRVRAQAPRDTEITPGRNLSESEMNIVGVFRKFSESRNIYYIEVICDNTTALTFEVYEDNPIRMRDVYLSHSDPLERLLHAL